MIMGVGVDSGQVMSGSSSNSSSGGSGSNSGGRASSQSAGGGGRREGQTGCVSCVSGKKENNVSLPRQDCTVMA